LNEIEIYCNVFLCNVHDFVSFVSHGPIMYNF
jgi:hypothetical protein